MSLQAAPRTPTCPPVRLLVPAAFVVQALVSLLAWFVVDDRSHGGAWSNADFEEWAALSALCAALLAVTCGVALRRWWAAPAVAAGCFLAVISGCAVFVAYAVLHSA